MGGSPFSKRGAVIGSTIYPTKAMWAYRRIDQNKVSAKLLHEVKLAIGPVKGFPTQRGRQSFKVSERLEQ